MIWLAVAVPVVGILYMSWWYWQSFAKLGRGPYSEGYKDLRRHQELKIAPLTEEHLAAVWHKTAPNIVARMRLDRVNVEKDEEFFELKAGGYRYFRANFYFNHLSITSSGEIEHEYWLQTLSLVPLFGVSFMRDEVLRVWYLWVVFYLLVFGLLWLDPANKIGHLHRVWDRINGEVKTQHDESETLQAE